MKKQKNSKECECHCHHANWCQNFNTNSCTKPRLCEHCKPSPPTEEESWEKRFHRNYGRGSGFGDWLTPKNEGIIKRFIRLKIARAKEEVIEEIEMEFGVTSTNHAPMLGDGAGKYKQIVFMNFDTWLKLKSKLLKDKPVKG